MPSPEADLVLRTVADFLATPPTKSVEHLLVDDLAVRERILRAVPRDYEITNYVADVSKLALTDIRGEIATCECEARLISDWRDRSATRPRRIHLQISGPIELIRSEGEWRIRDWRSDGRPIGETFQLLGGSCAEANR